LRQPPGRFDSKYYVQQYINGAPISAVCFAAGDRTYVLGVSDLLIGDEAFGACGFQFVGAITPSLVTHEVRHAIATAAEAIARHCRLRGLFGIDTVFGRPAGAAHREDARALFPVEINPRYTASVEVVERARNHAALTAGLGIHPADPPAPRPGQPFHGKAIVYAQGFGHVSGDPSELAHPGEMADLPDIDAPVFAGQPICTLLATAPSHDECLARLRELATRVYARVH